MRTISWAIRVYVTIAISGPFALAVGQARLLDVSSPVMSPRGWAVAVSNTSNQVATAYAIRITAIGGGHTIAGLHWEDAIPGKVHSPTLLAPGETRTIHLGSRDMNSVSYSNVAVIYADGTTAGEPAVLNHLLAMRRAELTELPEVISILGTFGAASNPDRNLLLRQFMERQSEHRAALRDGIIGPVDRVCDSVIETLNQQSNTDARALAIALRANFVRWQAQLAASQGAAAGLTASRTIDSAKRTATKPTKR